MDSEMRKGIIKDKRNTSVDDPKFNIVWEGQPHGLFDRFLDILHMNFTWYKISHDELLVTKGFFSRRTDTIELYLLKDPDLTEGLIQRMLHVGTITVKVDSHCNSQRAGAIITLKNIQNPQEVRKLLRDYIEADVMERGVNYFDKV